MNERQPSQETNSRRTRITSELDLGKHKKTKIQKRNEKKEDGIL